jgi:hypothetical protein
MAVQAMQATDTRAARLATHAAEPKWREAVTPLEHGLKQAEVSAARLQADSTAEAASAAEASTAAAVPTVAAVGAKRSSFDNKIHLQAILLKVDFFPNAREKALRSQS